MSTTPTSPTTARSDDPDIIQVERNAEVRLRIINASASSNFTIDLGNLQGTLVTVDGNPIVPFSARRFPIAIAQRADIIVRVPADGAAVPVLAIGEGRRLRTGIILQPRGATVAKISVNAEEAGTAGRARAGTAHQGERAAAGQRRTARFPSSSPAT